MTLHNLTIAPIRVMSFNGWITIPGWQDGTFGVDWRPCIHDVHDSPGGYAVTHLATGYAITAVVSNIENVATFLEALHAVGDWSTIKTQADADRWIVRHRQAVLDVFDTLPRHNVQCFALPAGLHGAAVGNA